MKVLLASLSLEFPLAAYCLAAALRADPALADCDTALHDIDWPRMSHYKYKNAEIWRFLARLEAERPQVLGLSVYLWNHIALRELAGIVRRVFPHLTIVVGGPELATPAAAEAWLAAGEADIVVRGEGERVLAVVIRQMRDGAPLAGLPGTSMRIDGDMRHGPPVALRRLDDLPSPFLTGLVPEGLFRTHGAAGAGAPYARALIETYRGCYMECAYCQWGNGDKSRFAFAADRVRDEITWLLSLDVQTVFIVDAMFGIKKSAAKEILRHIVAEKQRLGARTTFNLYHNQDFYDPELFDLYRAAGVHIEIDLQSTNSAVLDKLGRGRWTTEVFERQLSAVQRHGVPTTGAADLIIGVPGDDLASFAASVDYLLRKRMRVNLYQASILPDTVWGRLPPADGVVSAPLPPRAILQTARFPLADMLAARLIGHGTDVFNSFPRTAEFLWRGWFDSPVELCRAIGDRVYAGHGLMYGESHQYAPSMAAWLDLLPDLIRALCPDARAAEILVDLLRLEGALAAARWSGPAAGRVRPVPGWVSRDECWRHARPLFAADRVQRVPVRWPVAMLLAGWQGPADPSVLATLSPLPHVELVFRDEAPRHVAVDAGLTNRLLDRFNGHFTVAEALANLGVALPDMRPVWAILSMLAEAGVIVPGQKDPRPPVPSRDTVRAEA
ncbi:B12-binding domain-containing radical SAM protein [Cereibacter sphaeroides]|jgi:hypothetical protein|uniref:B12-binding domain-containing radical SAM protein n=1 Tax=Cereibacter sphaeroides TaxID=1063 RepID=UPI0000665549|nr:Radical SAM domain protein [Cereibacter sphaeroides ATCC 17029]